MCTKLVGDLLDGDRFTADSEHWYTCAVVLFGNVAVYCSEERGDDAPTVRIDDLPLDRRVVVDDGFDVEAGWQQLREWMIEAGYISSGKG